MHKKDLEGLQSEDPEIQKKVYYEHCDRLMGVIYGYLQSLVDAEEVLQDTFLTIFEKIHTYVPSKGSFEGWSHRIAVNKALMFLRKKKHLIFTDTDLNNIPSNDKINCITENDKNDLVDEVIGKLPFKSAVVFRLKAIEGCSHNEIAEMLNIKTDASRAIFSRARKKLRKILRTRG